MPLKNGHQATPDHAKLLLIESIIPPGNEPSPAKFGDMIMLLLTGGRERSEEEY
jgi:O-methyltransferase domain